MIAASVLQWWDIRDFLADDSASLLLRAGLVDDHAVSAARSAQALHGGTVPEHLVLSGKIGDEELTEFFRSRLLVKRVSPNSLIGIPEAIIEAVPREMACRYRAMPVHLDDEGNLTVMFSDPADPRAAQEIAYHSGTYVVRAVATQLQLAWCLGHYYDFISPLGETMIPQPETAPRQRRPGVTGEVQAMRKQVMAPTSDSDEEASPAWIAAKADALKRQLEASYQPEPQTEQMPRVGEVVAKRESKMLPRVDTLPAVVIEGADLSADEQRERTTNKQKFLDPPPGSDPDEIDPAYDGSTRRLVFVEPTDPDDSTQRPDSYVDVVGSTDRSQEYVDEPTSERRQQPLTAEELKMVAQEVSAELETAVAARPAKLPAADLQQAHGKSKEVDSAKTQKMANPWFGPDAESPATTVKIPVAEIRDGTVDGSVEVGTESRPILLTRRSAEIPAEGEEIVLLEAPKKGRDHRPTTIGVAPAPSQSQSAAGGLTEASDLAYTGDPDGGAIATDLDNDQTQPVSKRKRKKRGKKETTPEPLVGEGSRSLPRSTLTASDVDDGWGDEDFGPPGSTIPPAYLGATTEQAAADAAIPVQVADAEPSEVIEEPKAAGKNNGDARRAKRKTAPPDDDDTVRLTETVKELGHTDDRNAVFELLMDYLASSHKRVAFFAVKKGKVCAWKHKGLEGTDDKAELPLEESTTFHGVVESQVPFHGSEIDTATQDFLTKATGNVPEDIIAAPVAIGPRVIGVLYGDGPQGHTLFDQQVSMVTRSAGLALQRILQAAKAK